MSFIIRVLVYLQTEASPTGFRELSPLPADESLHKDGCRPKEAAAEYESDFESEIQTETALSANEISEHFSGGGIATESRSHDSYTEHSLSEDPSQSRSICYSKSEAYSSITRSSYSSSYSSDATVTQSEPRSPSYRRPTKDAMVQTQRDGLTYTWSSGGCLFSHP